MRNSTKRLIAFRAFALANLGFVCFGLWRLGLVIAQPAFSASMPSAAYERQFFYFFVACNLALLGALLYSSWRLWSMLPGAVWHSTLVYAAIILYNLFVGMSWALPEPWGSSIGLAVVAGANAGLRALHATGYPLVAILLLNLVRHYTRMHSHEAGPKRPAKDRTAPE